MAWGEAKWVVDQLLQNTGRAPNNMRALSAFATSKTSIGLKFLEPTDSYDGYGNIVSSIRGVMIRKSTEGYPASFADGELVVNNTDLGAYENKLFQVEGLKEGTKYYFSAFPYSTQGVYNRSTDEANRVSVSTVEGEHATVTIAVDNDSAFESAVITCVDETNSITTQTAILTVDEPSAVFFIPAGDSYHIEYGTVEDYGEPQSTASKVAVANTSVSYSGTYYIFTATIDVEYPEGAVLTCTCDTTVLTAETSTGTYRFFVRRPGVWVVRAVNEKGTLEKLLVIDTDGQSESITLSFVKIYGISRTVTSSSQAWTRTDDSVGMTASVSIGLLNSSSDFDNCYPWSEMKREIFNDTDVMVKIPEFYYQRHITDNVEYIRIANTETEGFEKHPGSGRYVGAYVGSTESSNGNNTMYSKPGATGGSGYTRYNQRQYAARKGTGWGIWDLATLSAIQMLCLVEFATYALTQTSTANNYFGYGANITVYTGMCDSVPRLTGRPAGTSPKDLVYRGIESLWGGYMQYVDGVNYHTGHYYVCTDRSKYAEDTSDNYTRLSYSISAYVPNYYITRLGYDSNMPWVMLPSATSEYASSSTYIGGTFGSEIDYQEGEDHDPYYDWRGMGHGGRMYIRLYTDNTYTNYTDYNSTPHLFTSHVLGYGGACRLVYIPS